MFLSTQWKVPSSQIEELSLVEFIKQFKHWRDNKWGCEQDMLSLIISLMISNRSGEPPVSQPFIWKQLAVEKSAFNPEKVTASKTQEVINNARQLAAAVQSGLGKKQDV